MTARLIVTSANVGNTTKEREMNNLPTEYSQHSGSSAWIYDQLLKLWKSSERPEMVELKAKQKAVYYQTLGDYFSPSARVLKISKLNHYLHSK